MKSYTITVGRTLAEATKENVRAPISFSSMRQSQAKGAMAMADYLSYNGSWYFVLRCDQTGEVVSTVSPRKVVKKKREVKKKDDSI